MAYEAMFATRSPKASPRGEKADSAVCLRPHVLHPLNALAGIRAAATVRPAVLRAVVTARASAPVPWLSAL
jgi:hypothetical protein